MEKVVLTYNYFIRDFEKEVYIKFFLFSKLQPLKYHIICEGKTKCSKPYHLSSLLEDEFYRACSALHSAVSRKLSIGLQVTHVKKTVVPYGLALVNPFVSCLSKKTVLCSVCLERLVS